MTEKAITKQIPQFLSRQTCNKCVNDTSVPGISFNSNGICTFCEEYEKIRQIISDYEALKKLWHNERIDRFYYFMIKI